jgi:hypothetical protein
MRWLFQSRRLFSCCPSGRTVNYEVFIKFLDPCIKNDYYRWLSTSHINEVLKFDGFLSAELLEEYNGSGSLIVRYSLESIAVYESYDRSEAAGKLRQEAIDKFGDKFAVSRRVLISGDVFFR